MGQWGEHVYGNSKHMEWKDKYKYNMTIRTLLELELE
jgi:hypothetical protein